MQKEIARGLFYAVATVLILWTGSLTYSFVGSVLPETHWAVPLFALVVFDVGMIAWLKVYIDYAEGSGQRAVAIATCLFDVVGVGMMVLAEIFLGGQTLTAAPENLGEYALWGIGVWTVVNVGAVVAFHLFDPEARKTMALRTEMDAVFDESLKKLKDKRAAVSGRLSDQLSDGMLAQLMAELAADDNRDGIPDRLQSNQATPLPVAPQAEANGHQKKDFLASGTQ